MIIKHLDNENQKRSHFKYGNNEIFISEITD